MSQRYKISGSDLEAAGYNVWYSARKIPEKVSVDVETVPPASDFKLFSNAMYGKFAGPIPNAERGPAVCKCGAFAQIKATNKGSYCHKCGSTWSAGEPIRVQSIGIVPGVTWTGDAKDIDELHRLQKLGKNMEPTLKDAIENGNEGQVVRFSRLEKVRSMAQRGFEDAPKMFPPLANGDKVFVPRVAGGEVPVAKDPYSDSSLRDMLGEKDREIQALRQEVGRLSLELRRTQNAKNPKL